MSDRPDWDREGRDWPNRTASRFVEAGALRWHVQVMGSGPVLLLVHGTGAATHSWRGLAPLLAQHFTVLAPDLPGHGFTAMPPPHRQSLPEMGRSLQALLTTLNLTPTIAIGHSAGAAILARMALDGRIAPNLLLSLNGALLPLQGWPALLFSPAAKLVASCPLAPRLFALTARDRGAVERLIRDTGSTIDAEGIRLYATLFRNPGHIAGTLGMMAQWQLDSFAHDLPRLKTPLTLVAASNDRTIAPATAQKVRDRLPTAQLIRLPGLGHLAHEERPDEIAALVLREAHTILNTERLLPA